MSDIAQLMILMTKVVISKVSYGIEGEDMHKNVLNTGALFVGKGHNGLYNI